MQTRWKEMELTPIKCVVAEGCLPARKHLTDAGADLRANIARPLVIGVGESEWVDLGLSVEIPEGYFGLQAPRSGLGCNHGICLANDVGIIDSGYRGPVKAKLLNLGEKDFVIYPGDRVCQLVIVPFVPAMYIAVDELSDSDRGANGYGSTGVE